MVALFDLHCLKIQWRVASQPQAEYFCNHLILKKIIQGGPFTNRRNTDLRSVTSGWELLLFYFYYLARCGGGKPCGEANKFICFVSISPSSQLGLRERP